MKTPFEPSRVLDRGGRPTVRELLSSLAFNPTDGTIRLNGDRIVMQRNSVSVELRRGLIRILGQEETKIFLMRLGFHSGQADARFVRAGWPNLDAGDAFTAGTRLHTFSGVVRVETAYNEYDFKKKRLSAEFLWHDSAEAAEFRGGRPAEEPVCWTQLGYACGYASEFFDTLIVYKEIECAGQGHAHCRVVGKPADLWGATDPQVRLFRERIIPADDPPRASSARPVAARTAQRGLSELDRAVLGPVMDQLEHLSAFPFPVLVSGPAGSGRARAARHIHRASGGAETELRHVNGSEVDPAFCAELMRRDRNSRRAAGSAILIDGAERIAADVQPLLARAIEQVISAGGPRVIALVESDRLSAPAGFCPALWQLLSPLAVTMSPLRQRSGDIVGIAGTMLAALAERMGREAPRLDPTAVKAIEQAAWPGNLHQLRGMLTAVLASQQSDAPLSGSRIADEIERLSGVPHADGDGPQGVAGRLLGELKDGEPFSLSDFEHAAYQAALDRAQGNMSAAARLLGLTRAQLAYRMKSKDSAAEETNEALAYIETGRSKGKVVVKLK